jgi:hypothetical protein
MKWKRATALTIGALFTVSTPGQGTAMDAGDEIQQLRKQLVDQRQYMEAMEKRLMDLEGREKDRAAKTLEAGYTKPEGGIGRGLTAKDIYDGGFYVRTEDGSFSLKANGFAQVRYTFMNQEHRKGNSNFDVALARLAFSGTVFDPKLSYFFQYEATTFGNNNRTNMLDWWLKYSFSPDLAIQAGRFILPYSRQFYTHPGNLLFADLSSADYAFNLQRAVGAHLGGKFSRLAYDLAITNSIRALDGGGQQNVGKEIAALGRVELDVLDPYGYLESSPKPASAPQLSVGVAASYNPIDEGSVFQNVMPGDRTTNVTVDAGYRWDRFTLQAAGYYRRNSVKGAGRPDNNDWGYYGQLGYYLVPELWELAGRVSGVNFDRPNNPLVLGDGREYTVGLNYYLYGHNVKMQMDYSFLDNDNFVSKSLNAHRFRVQTQFLF